jgi:hypothetical protein
MALVTVFRAKAKSRKVNRMCSLLEVPVLVAPCQQQQQHRQVNLQRVLFSGW